VVRKKELREALSRTSPFAKYAKDAPVVVCVAGRKDNPWSPYDCAIAASYLLLAAANLGLGTTYCGLDEEREEKAREVLGMPGTHFIHVIVPLGYPAEKKKPHTKYLEERIHWDRFEKGRSERIMGH